MELNEKIIFYDGDCGFCNKSVQFVLKNERHSLIQFSALQSEFTKQFFKKHGFATPNLSTFYFYSNGVLYERSSAALELVFQLKWKWQFLHFGRIIPRFLRDKVYDFIAARRQKISNSFCVLPSESDRKRFLN